MEDQPETLSQEIVKNHLELAALIQDIQQCEGPIEVLNQLNEQGRQKIAAIRSGIKNLSDFVEFERNAERKQVLAQDVKSFESQLSSAMIAFRKANILSSTTIETKSREELLHSAPQSQKSQQLVQRKSRLGEASSEQITEKLMELSKSLMQSTQMSAETLDALVLSSDKVTGTRKELEHQQQAIAQSGKLLGKYGRREITDKALLVLAFGFFLAVVFYILQKRLF